MLSDSEKLITFRQSKNLTQAALARALGLKQQQIAMIESDIRKASKGFKLAFLKTYGIDWDTQTASAETFTYEHLKEETNVVPIPFYSAKAAAGVGVALPDYPEKDVIYFDKRWLKNVIGVNPDNVALIQASGDSMQSTPAKDNDINDGDLLMVDDSCKEPINNLIFVVNLGNNDIVVKRIAKSWDGSVALKSNNPKYSDIIPSQDATIIGRVVWNGSKENI